MSRESVFEKLLVVELSTVTADVLGYSGEKVADLLSEGCVAAETGASQP